MAKRKVNPWAACGASVGHKSKKYERCVQKVKKQQGMESKEPMNDIEKIASFLTDDPNIVLEQDDIEASETPPEGEPEAPPQVDQVPGETPEVGEAPEEPQYVIIKFGTEAPESPESESPPEELGAADKVAEEMTEDLDDEASLEDEASEAPEGEETPEASEVPETPEEPPEVPEAQTEVWGPYPNRESAINDLRKCIADDYGSEKAQELASQISSGVVQINGVTKVVTALQAPGADEEPEMPEVPETPETPETPEPIGEVPPPPAPGY